ncbi:MAG: DUF4062 domain-containing protein [Phycisphaerales bacterium]|jgi:hypothetical protein|nr:DUF4062 domain-containing protein [Phycisphaerales bacterium]
MSANHPYRTQHVAGIFIVSPSGVEAERQFLRDRINEFSENHSTPYGLAMRPVGVECVPGTACMRPQSRINEDITNCDYCIVILHDRWGTPTGGAKLKPFTSGVEEEFDVAMTCLQSDRYPMRDVVVFFKDVEPALLKRPDDQLQRVVAFRKKIEKGRTVLYKTFSDLHSFLQVLDLHLARWLKDYQAATAPRARSSKAHR